MTWDEVLGSTAWPPGAWPDEPWGDGLVVKVSSKIFAFLGPAPNAGPAPEPAQESPLVQPRRPWGFGRGQTREVADEWLARYPDEQAWSAAYIGRSGWNSP